MPPLVRSTSPRSSLTTSPDRNPVLANNPISVAIVRPLRGVPGEMKPHASISDVSSASLRDARRRNRPGPRESSALQDLGLGVVDDQVLVESAEHAVTDRAAVGGATERQDEVQRHRPGGGRTQLRSLDVANESPQRAGFWKRRQQVRGGLTTSSRLVATLFPELR